MLLLIYKEITSDIGPLNPAFHWYSDRVASVIEFSVWLFSLGCLFFVTFFPIPLQYNIWLAPCASQTAMYVIEVLW